MSEDQALTILQPDVLSHTNEIQHLTKEEIKECYESGEWGPIITDTYTKIFDTQSGQGGFSNNKWRTFWDGMTLDSRPLGRNGPLVRILRPSEDIDSINVTVSGKEKVNGVNIKRTTKAFLDGPGLDSPYANVRATKTHIRIEDKRSSKGTTISRKILGLEDFAAEEMATFENGDVKVERNTVSPLNPSIGDSPYEYTSKHMARLGDFHYRFMVVSDIQRGIDAITTFGSENPLQPDGGMYCNYESEGFNVKEQLQPIIKKVKKLMHVFGVNSRKDNAFKHPPYTTDQERLIGDLREDYDVLLDSLGTDSSLEIASRDVLISLNRTQT